MREGRGPREKGTPGGGFGLYFLILCHRCPLMLTYTSLWICGLLGKPIVIMSEPRSWPIAHSLMLKTGFCDFFLKLNYCVWYFSDKIKKRKKKILRGWMLNLFVSPFTSIVSYSTSGLVSFTLWPVSLGMMLSTHCQCENISEGGKENYVAHKLVYYIYGLKTFFIVVLTLLYKNENGKKKIPLNSLLLSYLPSPEMLVSTATLDIKLWL